MGLRVADTGFEPVNSFLESAAYETAEMGQTSQIRTIFYNFKELKQKTLAVFTLPGFYF